MTVSDDYDLWAESAGKAGKRESGDLVSFPNEGRSKHVDVVLNASDVWVEEIGDHTGNR
jgi:hypothetical protein